MRTGTVWPFGDRIFLQKDLASYYYILPKGQCISFFFAKVGGNVSEPLAHTYINIYQ